MEESDRRVVDWQIVENTRYCLFEGHSISHHPWNVERAHELATIWGWRPW